MKASLPSSLFASSARISEQPSRAGFIWRAIGIVVFAALLAKWTWIFMAPKDAALPTTAAWKKTSDADHLFGDVPSTGVASSDGLGNVQLVGVFAHPTEGFAVLSVDGKQIGVGLGELVMPGAYLAETKADYVVIEQGGVRSRLDLPVGKSPAVIVGTDNPTNQHASLPLPETVAQTVQLSPEQRTAMQQELQHFRRRN